jgi:2-keto-4-pentenoate hydratase
MDKHRFAAALLWDCAESGRFIDGLADDIRPTTRSEGYAVQAQWPIVSGERVVGWKIAATSQAGREHIGVSGPLAGRILNSRVYADGSEVPSLGNGMRVAEPEFGFAMARDLAPRGSAYTVDEVLDAVDCVFPSIELPSSRFADFVRAGEGQLLADNACAGRFVFGARRRVKGPQLDLGRHEVRGTVERNGTTVLERLGTGTAVLGDPRAALAWLVNEVNRLGLTLRAGHVVSTGTCMVPMPIEPGDIVRADYGALGRVALTFVDHGR